MSSWRNDWFVVGSIAGVVGSVLKTGLNLGLYKVKASDLHYLDIAGGMILGHRGGKKPRTRFEYGLGTGADLIMGSMFGAGLAFLIGKTPKGHEVTKGALFGTALWSTTLAVGTLLQINGLSHPKPKTMATMLGASVAYGAGTGFLIKKYAQFGQAKVQQPSDVLIQNRYEDNSIGLENSQYYNRELEITNSRLQ
ncbi:hypothetical protein [Dehalobacter sp. TeCB1]|uniref:hypothetical protein n=1 Tax=Dehalobacter sp. TeCB1 TaxID=1843715 RepID=UPI00083AA022|nr:hypothetical protein [Dehalobacter sp. TeCB1]OCZ54271.1 hypothetical protein A7D23_05745 [Dehalobacter sp. TeCB1]